MRAGGWRPGAARGVVEVYVDNDRSARQRKPRWEYLRMRADPIG